MENARARRPCTCFCAVRIAIEPPTASRALSVSTTAAKTLISSGGISLCITAIASLASSISSGETEACVIGFSLVVSVGSTAIVRSCARQFLPRLVLLLTIEAVIHATISEFRPTWRSGLRSKKRSAASQPCIDSSWATSSRFLPAASCRPSRMDARASF